MEEVWNIAFGPRVRILVHAAINYSVPHKLTQGPQTIHELCEGSALLPSKLERTLLALEAFGYFSYDEATNKWSNNELSEFLTHPLAQHLAIDLIPIRLVLFRAFEQVLQQNDCTAIQCVFNMPAFEYMKAHPELLRDFQIGMTGFTLATVPDVLAAADFMSIRSVLDVGGGDGTLLFEIMKQNPHLKGGILERQEIQPMIAAAEQRYELEAIKHVGNFLEEVPKGYDCIIMKHIIHDWPDAKCLVLLRNCREALEPGQALYVIDAVLKEDEKNTPHLLQYDIRMMLTLNGAERYLPQFRELFAQTGFAIESVRDCVSESVIKAIAV